MARQEAPLLHCLCLCWGSLGVQLICEDVSSTSVHHFFKHMGTEVKPSSQGCAHSSVIFLHLISEMPCVATVRAGDPLQRAPHTEAQELCLLWWSLWRPPCEQGHGVISATQQEESIKRSVSIMSSTCTMRSAGVVFNSFLTRLLVELRQPAV